MRNFIFVIVSSSALNNETGNFEFIYQLAVVQMKIAGFDQLADICIGKTNYLEDRVILSKQK